jgi:hypothetical protein
MFSNTYIRAKVRFHCVYSEKPLLYTVHTQVHDRGDGG